jgi:hypothetical protein
MSPAVTDVHLINLCSVTCNLQARNMYMYVEGLVE